MTATMTRAERAQEAAEFRRKRAESDPLWNPLSDELYYKHEVEIENVEYLLPEGSEIEKSYGMSYGEMMDKRRAATDEECRQFTIELPSGRFDIEGDIATQVADHLVRLANELLESAKRIREEDLTYDWEEEDESEAVVETEAA